MRERRRGHRERFDRARQCRDVACGHELRGAAGHVRHVRGVVADDGAPHTQGLDDGQPETLVVCREHERVSTCEEPVKVVVREARPNVHPRSVRCFARALDCVDAGRIGETRVADESHVDGVKVDATRTARRRSSTPFERTKRPTKTIWQRRTRDRGPSTGRASHEERRPGRWITVDGPPRARCRRARPG